MNILKLFPLLLCLTIPSPVAAYLALPGCNDTCGAVSIPYPFGIGSNCSLNHWYALDCLEIGDSFVPRLWMNETRSFVQVLNISLVSRTVTVRYVASSACHIDLEGVSVTGYGFNLTGSPFYFSKEDNRFILFGCGNSLLIQQGKVLSGCTSMCIDEMKEVKSCYGVGCCETSVPYYLSNYDTNFTRAGFNFKVNYSNFCISTFLVDQNWVPESSLAPFSGSSQLVYVPVVLTWTIPDSQAISACHPQMSSIQLESHDTETWICPCNSSRMQDPQINPYLDGQCIDQSTADKKNNGEAAYAGTSVNAFAVATVSLGVLLLVAASFTLCIFLKRRRNKLIKEKFFKRNGGLLLQNQVYGDDSIIEKTRIFSAREVEKATDHFNENRILGRGGQGTVYKGMLSDGRIVAIKKSKRVDESQIEQFINEVVVLSQVVHKNVVNLHGCCLESEVPLLVYEFIANGTLFDLIHNKTDQVLTWNIRLRIATEAAVALAYLHTAVSIPIYHRDIKSSNILLDEKYTAKVSDFGTSKSIATDKTHVTTLVKGTFGYLDPEYFQSSQFTEKSDVYSFGVVLVELLTKQKAVSLGPGEDEDGNMSLAGRFLESMEQNGLDRIVDAQILDQKNRKEIITVAKLAERCLNLNGKKRPSMREVAMDLERIRISRMEPNIEADFKILGRIKEEPGSFSDSCSTSTWRNGSSSISSISDAEPFLYNATI